MIEAKVVVGQHDQRPEGGQYGRVGVVKVTDVVKQGIRHGR